MSPKSAAGRTGKKAKKHMVKKEYNMETKVATAEELAAQTKLQNEQRQSMALAISADSDIDLSKLERRGTPNMVKPGDIPVGSVISAKIKAVLNSPTTTIKGFLFHLQHKNGTEFTFPVTGVVRNALAPGIRDDDAKLKSALEKEVGKTLILKRLPSKIDSKFKKEMFVFDVFTTKG